MQIDLTAKGLEIDSKLRNLIENKLVPKIDKVLPDYPEDEKLSIIRLERGSRYGFKISFSMILPKKEHIFAEVKNKQIIPAVTELREHVVRQIKEYKERIRGD